MLSDDFPMNHSEMLGGNGPGLGGGGGGGTQGNGNGFGQWNPAMMNSTGPQPMGMNSHQW